AGRWRNLPAWNARATSAPVAGTAGRPGPARAQAFHPVGQVRPAQCPQFGAELPREWIRGRRARNGLEEIRHRLVGLAQVVHDVIADRSVLEWLELGPLRDCRDRR